MLNDKRKGQRRKSDRRSGGVSLNEKARMFAISEYQSDCIHDWKYVRGQQVDLNSVTPFAFYVNVIEVQCKKCGIKLLGMTENSGV